MSLATPSCVQKLQAASHGTLCVFSESRMREICLSGSMSGNRNFVEYDGAAAELVRLGAKAPSANK